MSAKGLMWLGAYVGVVIFAMDVISNPVALSFAAFCGGALFGKGYAIWERSDA
jgi:hypothetical protein